MADNIMDRNDANAFILQETLENKTLTRKFNTAKKYVDKDITHIVTVQDAELTVADKNNSNVITVAESEFLTDVVNNHGFTVDAKASIGNRGVSVTTPGWIDASDNFNVEGEDVNATSVIKYIKEGELGGEGNASITSENVKLTEGSGAFELKASAAGEVSVTKAGWIDANTKVSTDSDVIYNIQAANVSNKAKENVTYEEGHSGAVVSGGYLYIDEGYIKDTKISLAEIVPDDANIGVTTSNDLIYKTVTVYDRDGALVTGSMQDATLGAITASNANAEIDTITVVHNEENEKFEVIGSKAIAGTASVAVETPGYATTALSQSGNISGTATVDAELNIITLNGRVEGDGAVKPVIEVADSNTAKVVADSNFKITVNTAAIESNAVVTPTVTGDGYGTTTVNNANPVNVTTGAEAATATFCIQAGNVVSESPDSALTESAAIIVTPDKAASSTDIDLAGVLSVAPTNKPYITLSAQSNAPTASGTGNVVTTVSEGYVTADLTNTKAVTVNFSTTAGQSAQYIEVYNGEWV